MGEWPLWGRGHTFVDPVQPVTQSEAGDWNGDLHQGRGEGVDQGGDPEERGHNRKSSPSAVAEHPLLVSLDVSQRGHRWLRNT